MRPAVPYNNLRGRRIRRRAGETAMRAIGISLSLALAGLALGTVPSRADPPLAGVPGIITTSHGQPFCTDKAQLLALLRAQISQANFPLGTFSSCSLVPDNFPVAVTQDLSPRSRMMHVVRARAALPFGAVEGYTFSVGIYPY